MIWVINKCVCVWYVCMYAGGQKGYLKRRDQGEGLYTLRQIINATDLCSRLD